MKCKDCAEGRRFAPGSTYCILYGMIVSDEHECTLPGGERSEGLEARRRERDTGEREPDEGWAAIDEIERERMMT